MLEKRTKENDEKDKLNLKDLKRHSRDVLLLKMKIKRTKKKKRKFIFQTFLFETNFQKPQSERRKRREN